MLRCFQRTVGTIVKWIALVLVRLGAVDGAPGEHEIQRLRLAGDRLRAGREASLRLNIVGRDSHVEYANDAFLPRRWLPMHRGA